MLKVLKLKCYNIQQQWRVRIFIIINLIILTFGNIGLNPAATYNICVTP